MTEVPSAADVAAYVGKESTDAAMLDALEAETAAQAAVCRVAPYTDDLAQALKRRVRRNLAMRNVPLGVQLTDDGATIIARTDAEVRRLEAPYRRMPIG